MLLERLKSETLPQHRALESSLDLPESRQAYRHRLSGFLGYVEPWEARLTSVLRHHPGVWKGRLKTNLLKRDLCALGLNTGEIEALPRCMNLPLLDSVAAAVGSLYVMEGSTLGGRMIVRALQQSLELPAESLSYFSSYGAEVGERWKEFREQLLGFSSPENDELIIYSAGQTFSTLETWFSSVSAHGCN